MANPVWAMEEKFKALGHGKSVLLGAAIGAGFSGIGLLVGQIWPVMIGMAIYFPLHFWLTISLFLAVFSAYERERLIGPGHSFIGGLVFRLFSAYGLFCIGWFYVSMGGLMILRSPT